MTTEDFLALCYKCKLTRWDLEDMPVNMVVEYISSYIEASSQEEKPKKATQADFDRFAK